MSSLNGELLSAASNGDLIRLKSLLGPSPKTTTQRAGLTLENLTGAAAHNSHAQTISYLLTHGVDLSSWDILLGVLHSKSLAIYKVVLAAGYDVNHDFDYIGDAIIYTASTDDIELAKFLLANGADVNLHLQTGQFSALAVAARSASVEMVELLIGAGAVIDQSAAVMLAAELGRVDVVRCLIRHGADFNITKNRNRFVPLHPEDEGSALLKASAAGHVAVVELLLEKGASVDLRDGIGRTALMRAEQAGHSGIVDLLRSKGAR